jgi:hypothetical protein
MSENAVFDREGRRIDAGSPFLVFRLSWVAYLREALAFLLRFLICGFVATGLMMAIAHFTKKPDKEWILWIGLVVPIVWTAYSVALTRSVVLFTDETGVWVRSGIFPWQRGMSGVQWRDVGQASFTQGFASWILRSYDIRVSHRFTHDSELFLKNVRYGHLAVEHINRIMAQLQGRVVPA